MNISRVTSASAADVWNVLADGWLYPTWVVGASRMRDVEATWPRVGSRLHHSFGLWPLLINDNTEVLACEPPRHLRLQAKGWPAGEATVDITIEPHTLPNGATGARVVLAEDATKGPGRFVPKALRSAALGPRNNETLRRLAFLAEGHAGASPTGSSPTGSSLTGSSPAGPAAGEQSAGQHSRSEHA